MSAGDYDIPLLEFAHALAAAARFYGSGLKRDRELLHERLLPALTKAAEEGDAHLVAFYAEEISSVVKHPDGDYENIAKFTEGIRLG